MRTIQFYGLSDNGEVIITKENGKVVVSVTHVQLPDIKKELTVDELISLVFTNKTEECKDDINLIQAHSV